MISTRWLYAKIFATGAIVLALELAASRIMTPFFGVSLYVWSAILSVTLIALALGYRFGGILASRLPRDKVMVLFAGAGGAAALWLVLALWTYPFLFRPLAEFDLVFGSIVACLYMLFVPLVILSALNPLLVALLPAEGKGDHGAGAVFFISTVGSVLGVFVAAYGLMPYFTNYQTVGILTLLSASSSLPSLAGGARFRVAAAVAVAALLGAGGTLATGGLERSAREVQFANVTWKTQYSAPSYFGHVSVVDLKDSSGRAIKRAFLNDGLAQNFFLPGGESASLYTYALERMSFAAAQDARSALVLGIGGGVLPMAYDMAGLETRAVDINPVIVRIAEERLGFLRGDVKIDIADARTAARRCDRKYDIVAVDLFRDDGMPEHLVTREFFSDIENCLNPGGVMVMNSFTKLSQPEPHRALLQTIADVFGAVDVAVKTPDRGSDFTSAFLITRKGGPVGPLDISVSGMPDDLTVQLTEAVRDIKIYGAKDPLLRNAPVLTDMSNQWKHLAQPVEVAYRRAVIGAIPWQILLN